LINILKGEMSFIGPRPELLLYTMQYTKDQECIQWVRPGISDESSLVYISQDELVGEDDPVGNYEKYILPKKNALRVEYALSQSFSLDAKLFWRTIMGVFQKAGRVVREESAKTAAGKEQA
jgi:lipopolysaccharide/colanic/teichoic acid biosynthesis glycosyltransferase